MSRKASIPYSEHKNVDEDWFRKHLPEAVPVAHEKIWVEFIQRIKTEDEWDAMISALEFIQMKNRCAGW